MKVGDCPSCRAPVEFAPGGGPIKVCEYCQTVVVREGATLGALGKVAELVDTDSPLKVGLSGKYSGTPFTILGRIQKSNGAGTWDEWYLSFEDERQAWLAESEGDWKLLFPLSNVSPPRVSSLAPLGTFTLREKTFTVEERNHANTEFAEGQLPSFHREHAYVDATGPKGVFCTLDEADGVTEVFVGNFVTLAALGFDPNELSPTPKRQALRQARCTECNGPLELKAPDATKRVACPYCGALLEVQGTQLAFLQLLDKPPFEPRIPLGAVGALHDPTAGEPKGAAPKWTCLAFLVRSCRVEGNRFPWDEYLLWNRELGFRWLMHSTGHWTWLTPMPAGEVDLSGHHLAKSGGESYRQFQTVFATTEHVAGECYWQVSAGEQAQASEFIAPPKSINVDLTDNEATVTRGVLIDAELLEKAFRLPKKLNPAVGIAPAQPNPFSKKATEAWTWGGLWAGLLLFLVIVFSVMGTTEKYYSGVFSIPPNGAPGSPDLQRFSEPFEVKENVPLEVTVRADLVNNWLGVSVDLVNEKTNEVISVYAEPSYYSGTTDGESWSEGSKDQSKTTDVVDKGMYVLRVTPSFEPTRAVDYEVTVAADDGPGLCCPLFLFVLLLLGPIYYSLRANAFETSKWNDAVFQTAPNVSTFPYAKGDDDDD
jgi:LSD1 subclass zinc finger protein